MESLNDEHEMAIAGLDRAPEVCRPRNGDISKVFGVFKTVCCDAEIVIGAGVAFPDCPNHKNLPTAWKQISDLDPRIHQPNAAGKINLSWAARQKPA